MIGEEFSIAAGHRQKSTHSGQLPWSKADVQRSNAADQPAKLAQVRCNVGLGRCLGLVIYEGTKTRNVSDTPSAVRTHAGSMKRDDEFESSLANNGIAKYVPFVVHDRANLVLVVELVVQLQIDTIAK